jgi:hypothetical protein
VTRRYDWANPLRVMPVPGQTGLWLSEQLPVGTIVSCILVPSDTPPIPAPTPGSVPEQEPPPES